MKSNDTMPRLTAVYCIIMMIVLGMSDALRGVFLPVFRSHYALSQSQASLIIMTSYVGNLLFLTIGGRCADRMKRKHFLFVVTLFWMGALLAYSAFDHPAVLYIGMLFSMGASTMLSTSVNLITPLVFATPAFFINIFNFTQGIGISGAQNIGGRFADSIDAWQNANRMMLGAGCILLILLAFLRFPDIKQTASETAPQIPVYRHKAFLLLLLACGFYFVAEHGLQNWLVTYGSEQLGYTVEESAKFLSYFFLGITAGRLLFAPLIQKIGAMKGMLIFSAAAAVLYIGGMMLGRSGMLLLCASGLAFAILWPTMVLLIGLYYPKGQSGAATGLITGLATLFDIAFNAGFGALSTAVGFSRSILVLPAAMALFVLCLYGLRFCVKHPDNAAQESCGMHGS